MIARSLLPSWCDLWRAIWPVFLSDEQLTVPWRRKGEVAGWLSRSAWSLALIALWRQRREPAAPITVWLPDFFCNASLRPLRATGVKLRFYQLNEDMAPDFESIRSEVDLEPAAMFLLVHYFGRPTSTSQARDFCLRSGAWLVEDAVHVLSPTEGIGETGDFVLYSPHKHLPIPDGAVLVVRRNGPAKLGATGIAALGQTTEWSAELAALSVRLGVSPRADSIRATIWLTKRVVQKLGMRARQSRAIFRQQTVGIEQTGIAGDSPPMSTLTRRLLPSLINGLSSVGRRRQRRALLWDHFLGQNIDFQKVVSVSHRPCGREWIPYLAAFNVESQHAEAVFDRLQRIGYPVTTWPDLPPEVIGQPDRHERACRLRHSRVYLPVHQNLSIHTLVEHFGCAHAKRPLLAMRLVWNQCDRQQWQEWLKTAGRSNLLQSWNHGEAKARRGGWRTRRGVFLLDGTPIAVVQVLQKRLAGVVKVSRLSRGPVFLRPLIKQEIDDIWHELAQLGRFSRGSVLSVAPESEVYGASLERMAQLGFRPFRGYGWESIWLNLELPLDELRKRMDPKWRNHLNFSERAGLTLESGHDSTIFEWMIERYQELQRDRGFSGPEVQYLLDLQRQRTNGEELQILRTLHAGEPVAGICVALHGATATYLLGWTSDKGRDLEANRFLLWAAAIALKKKRLRWFDLGGISEEKTPGITAYKLGMNGERYELVGEYLKW